MKVTRILENLNDYRRGVELDQSSLIHELANHKALLLQSEEDPWSVHEFGHLLKSFNLKSYPYVGGAAPRRLIPCDAGDDFNKLATKILERIDLQLPTLSMPPKLPPLPTPLI